MLKGTGLNRLVFVMLAGVAFAVAPTPALAVPAPTSAKPAAAKGAPVAGKSAADWVHTMTATPQGGFRLGNPDAPVKLLEYGSLTCPHCGNFYRTGMAALQSKYIATGRVSYEYRSYVLNGPDMAAAVLARCDGPAAFFARADALYSQQDRWTEPFTVLTPDDTAKYANLPPEAQLAGLAHAGGLDAFMAANGMTRTRVAQCLADKTLTDRLSTIRDNASSIGISGTPMFLINGRLIAGAITWEVLEPALAAALH